MTLIIIGFALSFILIVILKNYFLKFIKKSIISLSFGYIGKITYESLGLQIFPFSLKFKEVKITGNTSKFQELLISGIDIKFTKLCSTIHLTLKTPYFLTLTTNSLPFYKFCSNEEQVFEINLFNLFKHQLPQGNFIKLLSPSFLSLTSPTRETREIQLNQVLIKWVNALHRKIEVLIEFKLGNTTNAFPFFEEITANFEILQGISSYSKVRYIKDITLKKLTVIATNFTLLITGNISYFQTQLPLGKYIITYSSSTALIRWLKKLFTLPPNTENILKQLLQHKFNIVPNVIGEYTVVIEFTPHGIIINNEYLHDIKKELPYERTLSY